jgi:class 3 adenylate cyclase
MLTQMSDADWEIVVEAFQAARSRRGDKGRDDRALGQIGFAERSGYTAIGTVCNFAARLCAKAKDGQILVAQRVAVAVEQTITLEEVGALSLKGLTQPVVAYDVPLATTKPALRVIEGGPQSV